MAWRGDRLGPLLFTGLVLSAATVSHGLLAARSLAVISGASNARLPRGTFIVHAAYVQGIGVLGVVEGLLAMTINPGSGSQFGLAAAGPAIAGAVVAVAMILRAEGGSLAEKLLGLGFAAGLGILGSLVGFLASAIGDQDVSGAPIGWYLLLAVGAAAGTFALSESGARAVEAASHSENSEGGRIKLPTSSILFEGVSVTAVVAAIVVTLLF